jgi:hypothetical protein
VLVSKQTILIDKREMSWFLNNIDRKLVNVIYSDFFFTNKTALGPKDRINYVSSFCFTVFIGSVHWKNGLKTANVCKYS